MMGTSWVRDSLSCPTAMVAPPCSLNLTEGGPQPSLELPKPPPSGPKLPQAPLRPGPQTP